jgi:hypothetical protein
MVLKRRKALEEKKLVNIVLGNCIRTMRIENGFTLEGLAGEIEINDKHYRSSPL